jgi:SSS family solute:Na+ symporter
MPLYQLILLFVFFIGFAAVLAVPNLGEEEVDLALLTVVRETFSPWFVGLIGAAGLLTALVPGSLLLMVSATILVKNVYGVFRPSTTEAQIVRYAKYLVPVVGLAALFFTLAGGQSIVILLLLGYSLVTQLFPAMLISLLPNAMNANKYGATAGILVGVATVAYLTITENNLGTLFPWLPQGIHAIHVGIVGLILNLIVLLIVSLATRGLVERERVTTAEERVRTRATT